MDREALIARLRERALNAREYWENYPERGGSMDDLRDADLEVAAEQEQAANALASDASLIATIERQGKALRAVEKELDSMDEMAKMSVPPEYHNVARWLRAALEAPDSAPHSQPEETK